MLLNRSLRLASLAAAAALSLTACGDGGADESQADTAQEEPSAPAESTGEPASEPASTGTPAAEGDLPDGWSLAEADDFTIGLPPGWFNGQRALNDEEFMAEVVAQMEGYTDAELASIIEDSMGDLDLLAFSAEDFDSGFSTNLNVGVQPRGPFGDVDALRELAPAQIEKAGATSVEVDDYEVNGIPTVELSYDLPDYGAKGIQNYLLAEDIVVIATYTAVEPDPELWRAVLDTVEVAG